MTRLFPLILLTLLAACAHMEEEVILEEPMMEPDVVLEEVDLECLPGDDDGIGGTGCPDSVKPDVVARHKALKEVFNFR